VICASPAHHCVTALVVAECWLSHYNSFSLVVQPRLAPFVASQFKTSTIQHKGSAGAWQKDVSNFERERVIYYDNEILVTGLHGELTEGTICQLQKPRSAMGDITPMTHTLYWAGRVH